MVSTLAISDFSILLMVGVTGVLTLFGVAWLFHHHFLKPLLGLVLVFIGAMWLMGYSRFELSEGKVLGKPPIQAIPRQATEAPRSGPSVPFVAESPDAAGARVIATRPPHIGISWGFVILLIVGVTGVLTIFGVARLFHHHFLKPVLGLVLVFFGAIFLLGVSRFESRPTMIQSQAQGQAVPIVSESPDAAGARVIAAQSAEDSKPMADQKPADPPAKTGMVDQSFYATNDSTPDLRAKPAWVDQPPHKAIRNNVDVYVMTATSGPYSTEAQCDRNLPAVLQQTVADFAAEHLSDYGAKPIVFDPNFLKSLTRDRYLETVKSSVGEMYQLHVLLPIDAQARDAIEQRIRERVINERLRYTAMGTLAAFILLGGVYSALKANGGKSAGG